ncbi:MAG: glycoside hydrolase family 26 protein [Actinomycetota bacterium]
MARRRTHRRIAPLIALVVAGLTAIAFLAPGSPSASASSHISNRIRQASPRAVVAQAALYRRNHSAPHRSSGSNRHTTQPSATTHQSQTPTPNATTSTPSSTGVRQSGRLVPSSGALLGAYVSSNGQWSGNSAAENDVTNFESSIGRTLNIDQHYYSLNDTFPSGLEQWDIQHGRTPLITWEPRGTTLSNIAGGGIDDTIRARASGLASLGTPVFLRFAHEPNGNWYDWSGSSNGNDPSLYVKAFRHVHDLMQQAGATNVVWVWSPNSQDVPSASWNHWTNYYPGDAYVDWVGIDGYNWGTTKSWSSWQSFSQIFQSVYNDYQSRKPIMIAETASVENGGSKAQWISDMASTIQNRMPDIAALLWFDVPPGWPVESSSSALNAFRSLAQSAYFNHP